MITSINEFRKINENHNVGGHFNVDENGNLVINIQGIDADDLADMTVYQGSDDQFLWQFFESELTNGYNLVPEDHKGLTEAPMISDEIIDEETDMSKCNVWAFTDYMIKDIRKELLDNGSVTFIKIDNSNVNEGAHSEEWQKWHDGKIDPAITNINNNLIKIKQIVEKLDDNLKKNFHFTYDILKINTDLKDILESYPNF